MVRQRIREAAKTGLQKLLEPEEPQPGLVPTGIPGLYRTPDEPADPRDCDRYPNSFYCGGNPISTNPVGLGVDVVKDECNLGVQVTPTLGFVDLPPVQIVARDPNCVPEPENPFPAPEENQGNYLEKFPQLPGNPDVFAYVSFKGSQEGFEKLPELGYEESYITRWSCSWIEAKCPGITITRYNQQQQAFYEYVTRTSGRWYINQQNEGYRIQNGGTLDLAYSYVNETEDYADDNYYLEDVEVKNSNNEIIGTIYRHAFATLPTINQMGGAQLFEGKYDLIKQHCLNQVKGWIAQSDQYSFGYRHYTGTVKLDYLLSTTCSFIPLPKKPPNPPPPPRRKCCMSCCPSTPNQGDRALLMLILRKVIKLEQDVKKASDAIGVPDLPMKLPQTIINKDQGWLGNIIPDFPVEEKSLAAVLLRFIKYFEETTGQWEIPIEVKDSDPTTPGDQPVGFKLANIAEYAAESLGLEMQNAINSETLINLCTRVLLEVGQMKNQTLKTHFMVDAMMDYMGFGTKEVTKKMQLLFTPGAQSMEDLVKEKEVDITVVEFSEPKNFRHDMMKLLNAAAVTQAVNTLPLNPNNIKENIKSYIREQAAVQKHYGADGDGNGTDDFDTDLNIFETGFTTVPGSKTTADPWGEPSEIRPRIREIGTAGGST